MCTQVHYGGAGSKATAVVGLRGAQGPVSGVAAGDRHKDACSRPQGYPRREAESARRTQGNLTEETNEMVHRKQTFECYMKGLTALFASP